jgi:hypothetical protein
MQCEFIPLQGAPKIAAAPFVWTGFSGFEWKDCSVVVVAVGM